MGHWKTRTTLAACCFSEKGKHLRIPANKQIIYRMRFQVFRIQTDSLIPLAMHAPLMAENPMAGNVAAHLR
jgi:hypothetical protein